PYTTLFRSRVTARSPWVGLIRSPRLQPLVAGRLFSPPPQRLLQHPPHRLGLAGIDRGEEAPLGRAGIDPLARGAGPGAASVVPLLSDAPKELPFRVLLALKVRAILGHGNEVAGRKIHHFGIGEGERPARHAVVSDAAQRVAVHCPEEDRLSRRPGEAPGSPQVDLPWNLRPAPLLRSRLDRPVQTRERLGIRREQRYSRS